MKSFLIAGVAALAIVLILMAQRRSSGLTNDSLPNSEAEKRILSVLDGMVRSRETYLSVPAQDGRMLRVLLESANAKDVVEIGASTGYSGLWICLALRGTGGHLTTFELNPGRATQARENYREAGVDGLVTVVEGDAHKELGKLTGDIDAAFIDADKEGYVDYLNQLLPRIRPGGLILAHNVGMAKDYVRAVTSNPALETTFYMEGSGLGITVKKR